MSKVNKLTYHQICLLVSQGRLSEIPSEYNIVWTGHQPCKVFESELNGDCLKFIQNEIASPTKIKIKGEYTVHVPFSPYDMFSEPMEFGDVFIKTDLTLTELKFIYEGQENIKKMEPYLRMWADGCTGREPVKTKKDMVFSIELTAPDYKLDIMDLLPQTCILEDSLVVNFVYDFYNFTNIIQKN